MSIRVLYNVALLTVVVPISVMKISVDKLQRKQKSSHCTYIIFIQIKF